MNLNYPTSRHLHFIVSKNGKGSKPPLLNWLGLENKIFERQDLISCQRICDTLFEWFRIWFHPSVPASPCYALHRGTDDQWAAVSSSADQRIAPGAPVGFYLRGSQSYNIYNAIHLQFQCCVWTGLQAQAWDSCSSATRVKRDQIKCGWFWSILVVPLCKHI